MTLWSLDFLAATINAFLFFFFWEIAGNRKQSIILAKRFHKNANNGYDCQMCDAINFVFIKSESVNCFYAIAFLHGKANFTCALHAICN